MESKSIERYEEECGEEGADVCLMDKIARQASDCRSDAWRAEVDLIILSYLSDSISPIWNPGRNPGQNR